MFLAVSGQQAPDFAPITFALADLIAQVGEVQRSAAATQAAAKSAAAASTAPSQSAKSESTFEKVLKSGFGVSPIVAGLIDLFTGSDPPAPLTKFALPPSVAFQAAETRDGFSTVDYDQGGLVRPWRGSPAAAAPASAATQQITVNVQAMDARSFLDRSGDIALAVREAMLNLNSINDVVNDL
jgi:hypothetical protein